MTKVMITGHRPERLKGREAEAYDPVEIPVKDIEKMIKADTWKNSFEQEEVMYNLESNLYSKEYADKVRKLLSKYEKV